MLYTEFIFKYASLSNLHFRSLRCSQICARRPFAGRGTLYTIQYSCNKCTSSLLLYSQTNSCIWLTKEAILGMAASPLQQKMRDLEPYFHEHIVKTVSSCSSSLAQTNRVKHVFDRSTLTTMINTLVFSKLFYCSSMWSNAADTDLLKLQAVQNFAVRIICVSRKIWPRYSASERTAFATY